MRRHFAAAAAAAFGVASILTLSTAVYADDASDDNSGGLLSTFNDPSSTTFDLGVDLTNVPITPAGVTQFMATLSPEGQQIMVDSCQHYLSQPSAVSSEYTLTFCDMLLRS